ncbi:MAG: tRNA preQ1(34) S-adenosylmethionine ribosyltransferase-isomerase QueA [Candidatus Omnitrophica bacterium]|nr:tRNA preQ1(34) S-adenosylmethionine ribosyltransferase-isomerase QueA [Candidatus Omnitrophota bacterium]
MKLSLFDYDLPKELIAQYPLKKRDQAKLLVVERRSGKIYHDKFSNLLDYLPKKSLMVLNDSKVIPARLMGRRISGGSVEVFLLKRLSDGYSYESLIRPLKRLKLNEKIIFNNGKITAALKDPFKKIVRFNTKSYARILDLGQIPLPPYVKREPQAIDKTYYQTIYAKRDGSVASPTAGLHFTKGLLSKIKKSGVKINSVTLHINYATFNPVKENDITKHKMYSEAFIVPRETAKDLSVALKNGDKIIAVGTTSFRVLETIAKGSGIADFRSEVKSHGKKLFNLESRICDPFPKSISGSTDLFVYPGYKTKLVDILITNFHLPRTTLFMLVCAFAGTDLIRRAYQEAIDKKYRFYSYGDCMLIL